MEKGVHQSENYRSVRELARPYFLADKGLNTLYVNMSMRNESIVQEKSLHLPPIILGGNIFGAYVNENETKKLLDEALSEGFNAVDTADVYSDGISESHIGKAIRGRRSQYFVCTKAGLPSGADPCGYLHTSGLRRKIESSLRRLNTDYIDLYQLHHFDPKTPIQEVFDVLNVFKKEGAVKHIGVSNYSIQRMAALGRETLDQIDSIQLKVNVLSTVQYDRVQQLCRNNRIALLAYGVLGRGVLVERSESETHKSRTVISNRVMSDSRNPNVIKAKKFLKDLANRYGLSVLDIAVNVPLRVYEVRSEVIGVRSVSQLASLVHSLRKSHLPWDAIEKELMAFRSSQPIERDVFGVDAYY